MSCNKKGTNTHELHLEGNTHPRVAARRAQTSVSLYKPLQFHIILNSQCEETKSDYAQNHHRRSNLISHGKCIMVIVIVNNRSSLNVPRKIIACTKKVNLFL
jgi:hypothetical protein